MIDDDDGPIDLDADLPEMADDWVPDEATLTSARVRACRPSDQLYLIGVEVDVSDGLVPVKIGISLDPGKRQVELQCGCPWDLILLAVAPGTLADEARLHSEYASQRIRGEWFDLTPDQFHDLVYRFWVTADPDRAWAEMI